VKEDPELDKRLGAALAESEAVTQAALAKLEAAEKSSTLASIRIRQLEAENKTLDAELTAAYKSSSADATDVDASNAELQEGFEEERAQAASALEAAVARAEAAEQECAQNWELLQTALKRAEAAEGGGALAAARAEQLESAAQASLEQLDAARAASEEQAAAFVRAAEEQAALRAELKQQQEKLAAQQDAARSEREQMRADGETRALEMQQLHATQLSLATDDQTPAAAPSAGEALRGFDGLEAVLKAGNAEILAKLQSMQAGAGMQTAGGGGGGAAQGGGASGMSAALIQELAATMIGGVEPKKGSEPSYACTVVGCGGDEELRTAFDAFDNDGGGTIDAKEFAELCKELGMTAGADALAGFAEIDADGSGDASFDEFSAWWQQRLESGSEIAYTVKYEHSKVKVSAGAGGKTIEKVVAAVGVMRLHDDATKFTLHDRSGKTLFSLRAKNAAERSALYAWSCGFAK